MSKLVSTATAQLRQALEQAIQAAIDAGRLPQAPLPSIALEVPADRSHGGIGPAMPPWRGPAPSAWPL